MRFAAAKACKQLAAAVEAARARLAADEPRLFVTDEEFNTGKNAARETAKTDPAFEKATNNDDRPAA